ncbi:hypothetical protein JRO89_XS15G0101900 [Xanthoceras sorbifolium]|uniref:Uncharacterized protein n=1 Tax=Xanthoceras sorbifolium TaxID=99658 RepID=A0ABQ8H1J2_9ROSI|nr:hypothetical protein JRO89_XS15G0101900 [Xanthoceras sorbifolium]
MLRCYSDPSCPSSKVSQNITKNTIPAGDGAVQRTLIRAPSLPPCIGRKMEESQEKEKSSGKSNKLTRQSSHQHLLQALPKPVSAGKEEGTEEKESATRSKSKGQTSRSNLQRAPSLPSYLSREDISQDKESDTRMSKLIQQAFANSSDILPKPHTSKGLTRSYSISRYRPPRSPEVESNNYNMNGINEMSRRYLNQSKSRKSPSDLESEEVQGFKDLGFTFEKQELSPKEGPVELTQSIFATTDDPTPIQVATSVLLTGAISIFLFRALRRRAKRSKELQFRSSGAKKSLKDEALDNLKAMGSASIESKSPPSPVQALLGGLTAGVIALILYKFTTTIEAALNRQTISDSFSVRQITITIRTIINGICYLATFVFGINSIGLLLYAGQLTINSFMEDSSDKETENKGEQQLGSLNSTPESPMGNSELTSNKEDQSSDNAQ